MEENKANPFGIGLAIVFVLTLIISIWWLSTFFGFLHKPPPPKPTQRDRDAYSLKQAAEELGD